jgi:hypothetical protein
VDIKAKIEEIVKKIQGDKNLFVNFQKEPIPTVEKLIGVDLPDELIMNVVDGVKARLAVDSIDDLLGGIKKLF